MNTITIIIHEAKTNLSRLIQRTLSGEEVIIANHGQPVVRVTPIGTAAIRRPAPGIDHGRVTIQPDFDALWTNLKVYENPARYPHVPVVDDGCPGAWTSTFE